MKQLSGIRIPRMVISERRVTRVELHGFYDASQLAYGACVYTRVTDESGLHHTYLVCSKSRVAPLKAISVPRLELCGAQLLAQLIDKVVRILDLKIEETYYWTDATIVLSWINSPSRNFNTFVANRVGNIQELTAIKEWHHVKTDDNPADILSRGANPNALKDSLLWWKGPKWLCEDKSDWPKAMDPVVESKDLPEIRSAILASSITHEEFDIIERFSSYGRLTRVVATCLRFVKNARCCRNQRETAPLLSHELEMARKRILSAVQRIAFPVEIKALKNGRPIVKGSRLLSLNPFLDSDGLLRIGGRLINSSQPYVRKHPIILPAHHRLTRLIIEDEHKKLLHAGPIATLSAVRARYWPLSARGITRADYWKSQGRKFCDFCKCWIADNKPSIEFHEGGKKHKENVGKRLKEIHKNSAKQAKQTRKFEDDLKKMENAAMAAYLKDVESNNVDLTAEKIMRDKLNNPEKAEPPENPNQMPSAAPDTIPRYSKNRSYRDDPTDVDYCNPYTQAKRNHQQAKFASQSVPTTSSGGENKSQGRNNKALREKRKGKKQQEDQPSNVACLQKLWYEARTPEGYTYYWHTETNESVWEAPAEGYMSITEQEDEAKERAIQEEFLEQIEKEGAKEKAELMEERRANAEREKLRELKKQQLERRKKKVKHETDVKVETIKDEAQPIDEESNKDEMESDTEEKIPYRRDYSVPEKPEPYGPWQTVKVIDEKPVDLQLPKRKTPLAVPSLNNRDPAPSKRIFAEKVVTQLSTGDSDDEKTPATFKKRKFGAKNVRRRIADE